MNVWGHKVDGNMLPHIKDGSLIDASNGYCCCDPCEYNEAVLRYTRWSGRAYFRNTDHDIFVRWPIHNISYDHINIEGGGETMTDLWPEQNGCEGYTYSPADMLLRAETRLDIREDGREVSYREVCSGECYREGDDRYQFFGVVLPGWKIEINLSSRFDERSIVVYEGEYNFYRYAHFEARTYTDEPIIEITTTFEKI